MDLATFDFYSRNSAYCAERWESPKLVSGVAAHFATAFTSGSTLLDIGCGSGRDLAALGALGHDVWGVEPTSELVAEATAHHPELEGRIASGHLPNSIDLPTDFPQLFDGVVCSAVIMHLPKQQLLEAFYSIRGLLKPGGRLLLSIPDGRPNIVDHRDPANRLFSGVRASELELIGERIGFRSIGLWKQKKDGQARVGHSWDVLLLEYRGDAGGRPLDIIALAAPALRQPHANLEIPAGKVAAARLGWSLTRFNGKLENVCDKLAKNGVRGVKSTRGNAAKNRKRALVEHCIEVGIVDEADLLLLDQDGG